MHWKVSCICGILFRYIDCPCSLVNTMAAFLIEPMYYLENQTQPACHTILFLVHNENKAQRAK